MARSLGGDLATTNLTLYNYLSFIITPYERNSLSAGIGMYSAEKLTRIVVATKKLPSNLP